MDLLSPAQEARLRANGVAWSHVERRRKVYLRIADEIYGLATQFPELRHPETRVWLVAEMIEQTDKDVWGMSTGNMNVMEFCELAARSVVGHESRAVIGIPE